MQIKLLYDLNGNFIYSSNDLDRVEWLAKVLQGYGVAVKVSTVSLDFNRDVWRAAEQSLNMVAAQQNIMGGR